ncbi:hypothetical protein ACOMHN_040704 [Nucella lapillus]
MKRTLLRYLLRYLHVVVTGLVVTSFAYVVIMQRVTLPTSESRASVTVFLTIGIPTLKRPKGEYFFSTLASLLQQSSPAQQRNMTLVIMLTDRAPAHNHLTLATIKTRYGQELSEGLIAVVSAPDTGHLFSGQLEKRTYDDSPQRVRWRSKQNLDYAALMELSANLSAFYLQLEDDVVAAANYVQHIQSFIHENRHHPWAGLELSHRGFIGKLFHNADLPKLVSLLRTFHLEMPCDFLLPTFYRLMQQKKAILRKSNLFYHQGKFSSLANVTRVIDRVASQAARRMWQSALKKRFPDHHNPPARLYTSISVFQTYSLAAAYNAPTSTSSSGSDFFWGTDVNEGGDITVVFNAPQKVSRIVVETGILDKSGSRQDWLHNGTVEVGRRAFVGKQGSNALCTDTRLIGTFRHGRFDQSALSTSDSAAPLQCFTIVITQAQKEWVAISDIAVFVQE